MPVDAVPSGTTGPLNVTTESTTRPVNPEDAPAVNLSEDSIAKKELMEVEIVRENGDVFLKLKIHPTLEAFFATPKQSRSEVYKAQSEQKLMFYKASTSESYSNAQNEIMRNKYEVIRALEAKYSFILYDYGADLVKNSRYNFSLLRTVGISNGISICITRLIPLDGLESWVKLLKTFVISMYKEFVTKCKITCTLNLTEVI